ncbi:glutamate--tRNA ligase family protein [Kineosporia mesophila]|uniref:Glutamate--tRNA ligase n=1 Tax=Kineosporia mesophila TaxID=566012 RepID=A0ABP6ZFU7_9ACTN|nr:glutamate--tRNA ligase family protein [Kineosporia mesophila]MCD5350581.1 glutamate--tRNA ligase [Kineosporia mesophila]
MLDRQVIDSLFPADLPEPAELEQKYPPRQLPEGAMVTRLGPSPTGFVHIGGLYVGMINKDLAASTGGTYLLRIEDTDQAREVEGAAEQFGRAFGYFGLEADEPEGEYGPYYQSQRETLYLTFARELLREGKAYLCFATPEELTDIRARQEASKAPTGYYGRWAIWRNATDEQLQTALDEGRPYVVRFRTPEDGDRRVSFDDAIRGKLQHEANRNDVVILKSSAAALRLPTYHFAHAVDDHLMRVTHVIRGEEWISSVPLHLQLFDALGFERVTYAHIAPLMKTISGGKRKLSKRKDPEAGVDFYIEQGFPAPAVQYYLRGLANGRLAEVPLEQALSTPLELGEFGVAGPLVDLVKLEGMSADYIASLTSPQVYDQVLIWAERFDPELATVLKAEKDLAVKAIGVEREGVENPRKDLRKWSDFGPQYGFFLPTVFPLIAGPTDERVTALNVAPEVVTAFVNTFIEGYQHLEDQPEWFNQIREAAAKNNFAPSPKEFKKNPDAYPGSIREASQLIRVALTGSTRSPDLHAIAVVLGQDEVLRRLRSLAG